MADLGPIRPPLRAVARLPPPAAGLTGRVDNPIFRRDKGAPILCDRRSASLL